MTACNKVPYASRSEAKRDARQIRQDRLKFSASPGSRPHDAYKRLHPYLCPRCGKWHLTSKKQRRKY